MEKQEIELELNKTIIKAIKNEMPAGELLMLLMYSMAKIVSLTDEPEKVVNLIIKSLEELRDEHLNEIKNDLNQFIKNFENGNDPGKIKV